MLHTIMRFCRALLGCPDEGVRAYLSVAGVTCARHFSYFGFNSGGPPASEDSWATYNERQCAYELKCEIV
jgi:hypothetical protein